MANPPEDEEQLPIYSPDITLTVNITSGVLTLSSATLNNYSDFEYGTPTTFHLIGTVFVNGASATTMSFNSSSGAISLASNVAVAVNDLVELRFEADSYASNGWTNDVTRRRALFLTVGSGTQNITFSSTTNPMPIPAFDLSFGWSGVSQDFKVAIKVSSDDSASQDLSLTTRRVDPVANSSTVTIDLDSTSTQTHTAAFTWTTVGSSGKFQIFLVMKSGTGTPRQEEHLALTFKDRAAVPSYAGNLPTDSMFAQAKVAADHAEWDLA